LEDLLNVESNKNITQLDLNKELKEHGHPQSRNMPNGKKRITTKEAAELAAHYEFYHNKKRK
jgi:hypothetical protein